tara:strand:+ start:404 stop:541 length:138 start_codon:yes stop_codon:yes gene_type:complete
MLHRLIKLFEKIGTARAASQLANMGYHNEAKALMLGKDLHKKEVA